MSDNEGRRFGRRTFLGGALATGAAAAVGGLGSPAGASGNGYKAVLPNGMAPSGARGLGPGGKLLPPNSLPYPHLPAGTDTLPQVEHVVILMMENHSFDDHFGLLGRGDGLSFAPDGSPLNYNPAPASEGGFILSYPLPNTAIPNNGHITQTWNASHLCFDNGTNMGFAQTCGPASMGHYTPAQLPFYYSLASQFPIGDRYFCSVMAQTGPNRRFLVAATALGDITTGVEEVSLTDAPNGTIFDRFDAHGITWRDYYPDLPTAAIFVPDLTNNPNNFFGVNQFLADAAAGQLPAFSLIDPYDAFSEESGDISVGEAYAARMIEAVMSSPNWEKTVIFLVYDEHGGWYDHVPPVPAVRPDNVPPNLTASDLPGAYDQTGFRVPCTVISPFSRRNFVSHTVNEHTSLLKFVETKWNLPAMTFRDANASNMFEFFDFHGRPPFLEPPTVAAPLNPFLGPLPAHSDGTDAGPFHPIATSVDAGTLPPDEFHVSRPPAAARSRRAQPVPPLRGHRQGLVSGSR